MPSVSNTRYIVPAAINLQTHFTLLSNPYENIIRSHFSDVEEFIAITH